MPDTMEEKLPLEFEAEVVGAAATTGPAKSIPVQDKLDTSDSGYDHNDAPPEFEPEPTEKATEPGDQASLLEKISATPTWKKVTAVAAWIVAVFFLSVLVANLRGDPVPQATGAALPVSEAQAEPIPDNSLRVALGDVRSLWNAVDQPPAISTPIRRLLEPGELDSFLHRFDTGAELIGAYPDQNDYLVALMARANLKDPAAEHMYLHLCHVINPFSPDCIESYREFGLDGQTWQEVVDSGGDRSWIYANNTWHMTVEGNLLTIRVLAPESN